MKMRSPFPTRADARPAAALLPPRGQRRLRSLVAPVPWSLATTMAIASAACGSARPSGGSPGSAVDTTASSGAPVDTCAACDSSRSGTQLVATGSGATLQVVNPTADNGYVIYVQTTPTGDGGTTSEVDAVPLAGGAPTTIAADLAPNDAYVVVDESTVFVWNQVTSGGVGTLTIWTAATGARLASTSSAALFAAASPDSTHVVFSTGVNAEGTYGDLVAAATASPDVQTTLVGNTVLFGDASFIPSLVFQPSGTPNPSAPGFVSNDDFVTSHEESGSTEVTISSWDTASWTRRDLVVGAQSNTQLALQNWNSDAQGKHIAALTDAGQLEVIPVEGPASAAVLVGPPTGTTTFALERSGDRVVYGNPPPPSETAPSSSLFTASLRGGSPGEVLSTGFGGFYFPWENGVLGPSPDGRSVLYFSTESTKFGFLYSLSLVADAPSSTPVVIDATDTATVPADPFTADSRYVIYLTDVHTSTGLGQLNVWDIAGGRAIPIGGGKAETCNAVSGSKIVYEGDTDASTGVADLRIVDVAATPLSPRTLQKGVDPVYYLAPDRSRIVYTISTASDPSADGIYVHVF